jgi:uncharacterized membrane protein YdbT with pleckstrin-like domain
MPEILYDAHPSMLRSRPFATPFMILLMLAGLAIALIGQGWLPVTLPAELPVPLEAVVVTGAGLVVAGLSALQLLGWWFTAHADRLVIRGDELVWTHGLLSKSYTEIKLSSVRTIRLHQSLLQRILNAGDVKVYTSGDVPELIVRGLPNPNRLRELIKGVA